MSNYVNIHVIQSMPPSNPNRDDTGAPKSCVYGGVRRARISSQSLKRAARIDFSSRVDRTQLGYRTKRVVELVAQEIVRIDEALADSAEQLATEALTNAGIVIEKPKSSKKKKDDEEEKERIAESKYLLFLSAQQVTNLAKKIVDDTASGIKSNKKDYKALVHADNSIDIALFGRMVADVADLGVDAAAQVAHAISVHAVENEADFYTAVDDYKLQDEDRDAGAGMMGTIEFNSSTLYKYANVSVDQLLENLGEVTATKRALAAFIESFILSLPTGKQTTFANTTMPDAVVIEVRSDRPVSLVGAFETPLESQTGYVKPAVDALVEHMSELTESFPAPDSHVFTIGAGARAEALDKLQSRVPLAEAVERTVSSVFSEPGDD